MQPRLLLFHNDELFENRKHLLRLRKKQNLLALFTPKSKQRFENNQLALNIARSLLSYILSLTHRSTSRAKLGVDIFA